MTLTYREALAAIIATDRQRNPDRYPPYSYQYKLWANPYRFKIINKSRQTGISWAGMAQDATAKALSKPKDYILVSRSERQAFQLGDYVDEILEPWPDMVASHSKSEKKLTNGSRLLCLPNSPQTIRTYNGDVYLDEFALFTNNTDYEVWRSVGPMISRGHNITIGSTPFGERGLFFEIWNNNNGLWDHFDRIEIPWWHCPDLEEETLRLTCPDDDSFRQEHCCEFLGETTNIFPFKLLLAHTQDYELDIQTARACRWWGMDVGRRRDVTAVTGLYEGPGPYRVGHIERMPDMEFSDQKKAAELLCRDAVEVRIDETGMGMQLAEDLGKGDSLGSRAVPVHFTEPKKIELITRLKNVLLDGKLELPTDPQLQLELHSLTKKITEGGHVKIEGSGKGHHADLAWSLALAVEAALMGQTYGPAEVDLTDVFSGGM